MSIFKAIMTKMNYPHRIAVLIFDGTVLGDLSVPLSLFPYAVDSEGVPFYSLGVCGVGKSTQTEYLSLTAPYDLSWAEKADTLIVPGLDDINRVIPQELIQLIHKAWSEGRRIVSLCTGAFILAQAQILHGLKVTTHWKATTEFSRRYSRTRCISNVLYVDNEQILTSAGATAALDLCLHVIRKDCGDETAELIADLAMVPIERVGIQPQLNHSSLVSSREPISHILVWIEERLSQTILLEDVSREFNLSTRTLTRLFIDVLGVPPAKWITMARINKAKNLLETSNMAIDIVAESVGYNSAEVFRENFRKVSKFSPSAYRRIYRRNCESSA
ncbi:helix-turn-helix domain-containing protein [Vibrio vulnificus]|nr:helix-turn-helix domain-containing protein [Vibrio vulnificus]